MQETWVWSLCWEDPLEKETKVHPSNLAWETPWTEGPGGLQNMGFWRVGHNLVNKHQEKAISLINGAGKPGQLHVKAFLRGLRGTEYCGQNKLQQYTVQHRGCSQCFIITINIVFKNRELLCCTLVAYIILYIKKYTSIEKIPPKYYM